MHIHAQGRTAHNEMHTEASRGLLDRTLLPVATTLSHATLRCLAYACPLPSSHQYGAPPVSGSNPSPTPVGDFRSPLPSGSSPNTRACTPCPSPAAHPSVRSHAPCPSHTQALECKPAPGERGLFIVWLTDIFPAPRTVPGRASVNIC